MSGRIATWIAWSLCGSAIALQMVGWALTFMAGGEYETFDLASSAALMILPVVGALIAAHRPGNAIGWLFCGAGLLLGAAGGTWGYAAYALTVEPELPGGTAAAWLTSWVFLPAFFGIPPLLFLLFPEGRPMSRRWRFAVALTVVGLTCQAAGAAFRPGPLRDSPVLGVENPVAIDNEALVSGIEYIGWTIGGLGILLATWSLVLRYRRSAGVERLQLRWFLSAAVVFLVACLISAGLYRTSLTALGIALTIAGFATIPIAAGVAILRHRLYDIDVIINRALVYASLTAVLAAAYLGSVLVLQLGLSPFTRQSDLAVAASTLAVAALFRPARARIQSAVDRRFYRTRYDAARTLAAFAGRLRSELDLEAVAGDLRMAVHDTVQPAHVSLWLRPERRQA